MMSGINSSLVDYIHLRYSNYEKYGTQKVGTYKKWTTQKNKITKKITSHKTKADLGKIESLFNAIHHADVKGDGIYNQAKQMINKTMNEKFNKSLSQLNYEKMRVEQAQQPLGIALAQVKTEGAGKKTHFKDIRKLTDTINTLENALTHSLSQSLSDAELANLQSKIEHIQRLYQLVFKKTTHEMEASGWTLPAGRKNINYAANVRELRNAVNEIISLYAKIEPIMTQEGYFLEATLAACNWTGHSLALNCAADPQIYETSLKGTSKVTIQRPTTYQEGSFVAVNDKTSLNIFSKTTSQHTSKVDVIIDYMEGEESKISAKNIFIKELKTWIHVLDEGNLVYLLESMDLNFVKHYLNTYNTHTLENNTSRKPVNTDLIQEMKHYLFYKAIAGDRGRDTVNVVAVQNKATGEIKLFHLGQVMDALKDSKNYSVKINNTRITEYYFQNKYSEKGIRFRLGNLLGQIHQAKVSASFNANMLSFKK